MTKILTYIPPMSKCINGRLQPVHHFYLDMPEHDDQLEVCAWVMHTSKPQTYRFWPEFVATTPTSSQMMFHVMLDVDRDAMMFRLRW